MGIIKSAIQLVVSDTNLMSAFLTDVFEFECHVEQVEKAEKAEKVLATGPIGSVELIRSQNPQKMDARFQLYVDSEDDLNEIERKFKFFLYREGICLDSNMSAYLERTSRSIILKDPSGSSWIVTYLNQTIQEQYW